MAKTGEREKRKQNQSGMEVNYKRQIGVVCNTAGG